MKLFSIYIIPQNIRYKSKNKYFAGSHVDALDPLTPRPRSRSSSSSSSSLALLPLTPASFTHVHINTIDGYFSQGSYPHHRSSPRPRATCLFVPRQHRPRAELEARPAVDSGSSYLARSSRLGSYRCPIHLNLSVHTITLPSKNSLRSFLNINSKSIIK